MLKPMQRIYNTDGLGLKWSKIATNQMSKRKRKNRHHQMIMKLLKLKTMGGVLFRIHCRFLRKVLVTHNHQIHHSQGLLAKEEVVFSRDDVFRLGYASLEALGEQ
jgi:hypothetical protein